MSFVAHRKIFYGISGLLILFSVFSVGYYGLNLGADFTGDAVIEGRYADHDPDTATIGERLRSQGFEILRIDSQSDRGILVRSTALSEEDHQRMLTALESFGAFDEESFVSRGPVIGRQLQRNALIAISLALLVIILFVAYAFRHVSRPISSWIYGLVAIVALIHDILIPTGIFAFLQIEIDSLFVSALLTVLGFSVHDTIVVFDRIRENLKKSQGAKKYADIVEVSLKETLARSINTSLTTLLALVAIYFFGGQTTQNLALALILGMLVGVYSSIFIASPLLVTIERRFASSRA